MSRSRLALAVVSACGLLAAPALLAQTTAAKPPATRKQPVKETVHGVEIVDPYRWLEGDLSDPAKLGAVTPEVASWTDAQNAYTRTVLDNLPGRAEVEAKLEPLMEVGSVTAPRRRGERYFYTKRDGKQDQAVVFWREGYRGTPKVLLDPVKLDPSGLTTVSWFVPSEDGKLLAYGTYSAGDENSTLHLLEVDSGKVLPLEIPNKVVGVDWLPDGSGFIYRNLWEPKNPYAGQVMLHRLGQPVAQDVQILRQYRPEENAKLATTYGPYSSLSDDGRWLFLYYYTGSNTNDLWAVDLPRFLATGKLEKKEILVGVDAQISASAVGDTAFLLTKLDAPNGRVVTVDLKNPARDTWKTFVPERKDAMIENVVLSDGVLAVEYLRNASNEIELFGLDGTSRGALRLPGIGSAGLVTRLDRTEAYLGFTSFNYPNSIFRVDLAKPNAEPELWESPAVPVDPASVEVKQEWYTSKDGTKVSVFVVHRKGLKLDGTNPTLLSGYGGFAVSETPAFSASMFQWYDAGGVYALANLRGGSEYGENWHLDGMLGKKQNVFDDFIGAAEHLVTRGYTRPDKLAIVGGSNGGLLTGAVLTQRPDLFGAVISAVPLLDMLRYQDFLMAKYWVPEYGAATDPEQFKWLHAYSPYHRVKPGTKYPAVFFTAGENDTRVHPLHARKMAALMQEATASDPSQKPVLLWVDRESGHGQGKPLKLKVRETADMRMFMMWQLGMLGPKVEPPARTTG